MLVEAMPGSASKYKDIFFALVSQKFTVYLQFYELFSCPFLPAEALLDRESRALHLHDN